MRRFYLNSIAEPTTSRILLGQEEHSTVLAEIRDIVVAEQFRRQGIGIRMLNYISANAREKGAAVLRSGTGIENEASDGLHKKSGFTTYRKEYEIVLDEKAVAEFTEPINPADPKSRSAD